MVAFGRSIHVPIWSLSECFVTQLLLPAARWWRLRCPSSEWHLGPCETFQTDCPSFLSSWWSTSMTIFTWLIIFTKLYDRKPPCLLTSWIQWGYVQRFALSSRSCPSCAPGQRCYFLPPMEPRVLESSNCYVCKPHLLIVSHHTTSHESMI